MANVTITRDTKANIEAIPITDGRIYFETDQTYNNIYADVGTNRIRIGGATALGSWTAPALQNSWTNFNGGYAPVGYLKDINGTVHLRGLIKGGTIPPEGNLVLFTLPPGYHPAYTETFAVQTANGTARIDVVADGNVLGGVGMNTGFTSLSGITFRAEN